MKTITTVLPVYDRINKQLYQRAKASEKGLMAKIVTPRHRLPAMLWNVEDTNPGEIGAVQLVTPGNTTGTDITSRFYTSPAYIQTGGGTGFTNNAAGYDVFVSVNRDITSAIKTTAVGVASCWNAVSSSLVDTNITSGDVIIIKAVLTLTSGTAPKLRLERTDTGASISNEVRLIAGTNYVYLTSNTTLASGWAITFFNESGETCEWSSVNTLGNKTVLPKLYTNLTDKYFQYDGGDLGLLLTCGTYFLVFYSQNGYRYYSEVFQATDVYENLLESYSNSYDGVSSFQLSTFLTSGTTISDAEGNAPYIIYGDPTFTMRKGETVTILFYMILTTGPMPSYALVTGTGTITLTSGTIRHGLNMITYTAASYYSGVQFKIYGNPVPGTIKFAITESYIIRSYSDKYLMINFSNSCDIGDIVYQNGLEQTIWIESEPMEMSFPQEERGIENGEARFIRTFARQVKKYTAKTKELPDYIAEVFYRMKLHDDIEITDLVGDTNEIFNLEVDHEWLWDDKYYCKLELTFDFDEVFVIGGCCNNLV